MFSGGNRVFGVVNMRFGVIFGRFGVFWGVSTDPQIDHPMVILFT